MKFGRTISSFGYVGFVIAAFMGMVIGAAVVQANGRQEHADFHTQMQQAVQKLDQDVQRVAVTGNAERDFAAMMISHQENSMEMARLYLKHGNDEQLRALAADLIERQQETANYLRERLGRRPSWSPEMNTLTSPPAVP